MKDGWDEGDAGIEDVADKDGGYEVHEVGPGDMLVEEEEEEEQSRSDFLLGISSHVERISEELLQGKIPRTRVSDGPGILCCFVLGANQVADVYADCFVRALYVEPGEDDNVMFRSKQPVFTTEDVELDNGKCQFMCSFEYDIYPPLADDGNQNRSNWDQLCGDMLFALYSSCGGRRNVFIGQLLVPLRGLVSGTGNRIHGGEQEKVRRQFPLTNRNNTEQVDGTLELELQLLLPPGEPCTPEPSPRPTSRKIQRKDKLSKDQKLKKNLELERDRRSRARRKQALESEKRLRAIGKYRTYRMARARELELGRIARENEFINDRILSAKRQGGVGIIVEEKTNRATKSSARTVQIRESEKEKRSLYKEQHEVRTWIAALEAELTKTKTSITKSEATLKRQKKLLTMVPQQGNTERNTISFTKKYSHNAKTKKKPSNREGTESLAKLRKTAALALEAYTRAKDEADAYRERIAKLQEESETDSSKIELMQSQIENGSSRRLSSLGKAEMANPVIDELEKKLHENKVELNLFQEKLEDDKDFGERLSKRYKDELERTKLKLAKKQQRLEEERLFCENAKQSLADDPSATYRLKMEALSSELEELENQL